MNHLPVYLLAGGNSSRFGSDKARVSIHGTPLITLASNAFRPYAAEFTVVAHTRGQYADLGYCTIADEVSGQGPLGGISTALEHLQSSTNLDKTSKRLREWCIISACDVLGIQHHWVETLLARCGPRFQVIAFHGEFWQPLPALYHSSLSKIVHQYLENGQRSLWRLIDSAKHLKIPLPDDWSKAFAINTPQDLQAFKRKAGP